MSDPTPPDVVCEHGTAMDVHCCGCHSGFLFDVQSCTCLNEETKMSQIPTIGRIVHYRLSADDAAQINRRRTTGADIAARMKTSADAIPESHNPVVYGWPAGAQAHIGNGAKEGDTLPMLIVKCWGDTEISCVNGQVFLDGNDVLWATSVSVGEGPHTWSWPERA
jgi:hypothetical protein